MTYYVYDTNEMRAWGPFDTIAEADTFATHDKYLQSWATVHPTVIDGITTYSPADYDMANTPPPTASGPINLSFGDNAWETATAILDYIGGDLCKTYVVTITTTDYPEGVTVEIVATFGPAGWRVCPYVDPDDQTTVTVPYPLTLPYETITAIHIY